MADEAAGAQPPPPGRGADLARRGGGTSGGAPEGPRRGRGLATLPAAGGAPGPGGAGPRGGRTRARSEGARRGGGLLPALQAALPGFRAEEERLFTGSPIRADVLRGALSRLPGRVHEERARQGDPAAFASALRLYERAGAVVPRLLLLPASALATGSLEQADLAVREAEASGHRGALALALLARGRLRGAPEDLTRGTAVLEALLTETGARSRESVRLRREADPAYELLARLRADAGRPEEAFATLAARHLVQGQDLPVPLAPPVEALRSRIGALEGEHATLEGLPASPRVEEMRVRTAALLAATRAEFQAALHKLYREEPAYQRLALRPVPFGTYVFVVTREGMRMRRLDVTNAEIHAAVTEFQGRMAAYTGVVEAGRAARSAPGPVVAMGNPDGTLEGATRRSRPCTRCSRRPGSSWGRPRPTTGSARRPRRRGISTWPRTASSTPAPGATT